MITHEIKPGSRQRGVVLMTGLIFLVMMTLLGVTAMQTTMLEEKMAGNLRDENLAFQAAEAALREGELFLEQITLPLFDGTGGLYCYNPTNPNDPCNLPPDSYPVTTWSGWPASGRSINATIAGVASQPRYIIEQLVSIPLGTGGSVQQSATSLTSNMYRVTARSVGGTESAIVILQSTYRR
ncbi:PilX N-terminal domain-containing pilus assembly protein [Nitrosomonas sp. Nm132]|jgi:type IV pilus assembly protein PilX|uniref:pilus assembly PilX family protein n=1 Tax=Nitrosomonas sp. Nm132 TaxID=1881053 RepID=UPI00088DECEA|nr:pilus assembly protein [Nitrosomonas sp. Nm132]SDH73513.1 type IV pilus assembly protein PilX [Nitrosomonas sp. Nm132]